MLSSLVCVLALMSDPVPESNTPEPVVATSQGRVLRRHTIALTTTAAVLATAWIGFKLVGTLNDPTLAREIEANDDPLTDPEDDCVEGCFVGPTMNLAGSPFLLASVALLGGGMHQHGRRLALERRGLGRTRRAGVILTSVGAGTLGLAALGLGLGLGLQWVGATPTSAVASREVGWWTGAAFGLTGAALAGLGHGILREHAAGKRNVEVSASPVMARGLAGVSVAGRF